MNAIDFFKYFNIITLSWFQHQHHDVVVTIFDFHFKFILIRLLVRRSSFRLVLEMSPHELRLMTRNVRRRTLTATHSVGDSRRKQCRHRDSARSVNVITRPLPEEHGYVCYLCLFHCTLDYSRVMKEF